MRAPGAVDVATSLKAAADAPLLVVAGGDRGLVTSSEGRRGYPGNTDLFRLLGETVPFHEFHLGKTLRQLPWIPDLTPYACVLNLVTDPDQNPRTLDNLRKLLRGFRGRVINRPDAVLRSGREQVASLLAGTPGLRVPRAIRLHAARPEIAARAIERAGLQFPVILRLAGTHTGNIIGVIDDLGKLKASLKPGREHIVIEFIDFKSADGVYRKCRVYVFGRRIVFRHMLISDDWNVHVSARERFMRLHPRLLEEEARLFARPDGVFPPEIHAAFQAVRERMPLDYFGLDFGIDADGQPVFFEANATMSFFPVDTNAYPYLRSCIPAAQRAFRAMVDEAAAGLTTHKREHA